MTNSEKEQRPLQELFLANRPAGAALVRPSDGVIVDANEKFAELFGYDPQELVGQHVSILNAGDAEAAAETSREIMDSLKTNGFWCGELLNRKKDGTPFWTRAGITILQHARFGEVIAGVQEDITEEKRAQKAAEESAARLRMVVNNAPLIVFSVDGDGVLTLLEGKGLEGSVNRGECLGRSVFDVYKDFPAALAGVRRALAGESSTGFVEARGRAFQILYQPLRSGTGDVVGVTGVAVDVTERKKAEDALRRAKDDLERILEHFPVMVYACGEDGRVRLWNKEGERVTGYTKEEVVSNPRVFDLLYPDADYRKEIFTQWQRSQGSFRDWKLKLTCRKGQERIISWSSVSTSAPVEGWNEWSVGVDVTEQVRAEDALRASESRLRRVLNCMPALLIAMDGNDHIIEWNSECERVTGYQGDEIIGNPRALDLLFPEIGDRKRVTSEWQRGHADFHRRELELVGKDGTRRQVEWSRSSEKFPIPGWTSWVIGVDVTDRRNAEHELEALRDQLSHAGRVAIVGEMTAGIAHELNQPLGAIKLYAESCLDAVQHKTLGDDELQETLSVIAGLAGTCAQIIRRLRGLAAKRERSRSTFDVCEVIRTALAFVEYESRVSQIPISADLPEEPLWMQGDSIQIQQVLLNLIRNAFEAYKGYGFRSPRIDIAARKVNGKRIEVTVRDRGPGISTPDTSRVFEPFFTTKAEGMGLGLAISKTIVEQHGGDITVRSVPLQGTAVTVSFPAAEDLGP